MVLSISQEYLRMIDLKKQVDSNSQHRNQNRRYRSCLKPLLKLHDYLLHESNRINRDPNRSHVANSFFLSSEQTNKIQSSDDNYEFYKFHSIPQRSFHPVVFQRILQRDEEIQGDNKEGRWCAEDKIKFRESTKRGRGANRISRGENNGDIFNAWNRRALLIS